MNICMLGVGYVGLVTGTCLAESGNDVVCVDIDDKKIAMLKKGKVPIYEPGLEDFVKRNHREERLKFTTDAKYAIEQSRVIFIAVGTPPDEDGSADLRHVLEVAATIGKNMNDFKVIVNKSTVPVGTADKVNQEIKKHTDFDFAVVSNPEYTCQV